MRYSYFLFIAVFIVSCFPISEKNKLKDKECYYEVNGVKQWVKIKGSDNNNTPIVVLHGGPGGNHYSFERIVGPLLEEFSTIVYYEQRGCGRSEAPTDSTNYQLSTLINDLDILRDTLGLDKMILLGYSFGAELSLRYAITHPDRVESLILSSPVELSISNMLVQIQGFYSIGDKKLRNKIEIILQDSTSITDKYFRVWNICSTEIVDKFLFVDQNVAKKNRQLWNESNLPNKGSRFLAKTYFETTKMDLIETVTNLKIPTLIICGICDKNGGLHTGLSLKQVLPNSVMKIYENSAHFPDMEESVRFANDVKNFIIK